MTPNPSLKAPTHYGSHAWPLGRLRSSSAARPSASASVAGLARTLGLANTHIAMPALRGSCQCGSVSFALSEQPTEATACHCVQCRKQSGHFFASVNLPKAAVSIVGEQYITWYQSSPKVRRGFCSKCGSWLFWEPVLRDWTSVALGSIDGPTGVQLERHIFVASKRDYYAIADGLPQNER